MCSMFPFRDTMGVLLTRCDRGALGSPRTVAAVGDSVHRAFETVDASKPLDTVFSRQQQQP